MNVKFEDVDKIEFSSTSNPTKILVSVRCKCGNKMMWVTEGVILCITCDEYSYYRIERR